MTIKIRKCTLEEAIPLQKISCDVFSETFKHQNSPENMEAYLDSAFNLKQLEKELSTIFSNSFLFRMIMKSLDI